jgi:hypothetical protein
MRASHGVSISHRAHGSTGHCQDPGRVFKGKKMAGHMGAKQITVQNLQVVATDTERGLILVKGAVPGAKGGYIKLSDAKKKPVFDPAAEEATAKATIAAAGALGFMLGPVVVSRVTELGWTTAQAASRLALGAASCFGLLAAVSDPRLFIGGVIVATTLATAIAPSWTRGGRPKPVAS